MMGLHDTSRRETAGPLNAANATTKCPLVNICPLLFVPIVLSSFATAFISIASSDILGRFATLSCF